MCLHPSPIVAYYLIQTLITLDLYENQIGDIGVKYLSEALKTNMVREKLSSSLTYSYLLFHTDTHYTQSLRKSNRRTRSTISGRCVTNEYSEWERFFTSVSYSCFSFPQTLTTLDLRFNQIGEKGAQYMSEALLTNMVGGKMCLLLYFILVSYFTQTLTTLDLRDNQIGDIGTQCLSKALRSNTVRGKLCLHLPPILVFYFTQTLTTLNLPRNVIGEKGAKYLGQTLQTNTVSEKKFLHLSPILICFSTDTYHTWSAFQSNWRERGTISGWGITNEHGERKSVYRYSILISYLKQTLITLKLYENQIEDHVKTLLEEQDNRIHC